MNSLDGEHHAPSRFQILVDIEDVTVNGFPDESLVSAFRFRFTRIAAFYSPARPLLLAHFVSILS
jgi:hypothetical protein